MSDQSKDQKTVSIDSSRFGVITTSTDAFITFPSGLIGFPSSKNYILIEHKAPFSWLQSIEEPALAFVVVDGLSFTTGLELRPPLGDPICDFKAEDEFAILLIVTVRADPAHTTVNLKAPVFVNIRNRLGTQVIYDDPRYSLRYPLWKTEDEA